MVVRCYKMLPKEQLLRAYLSWTLGYQPSSPAGNSEPFQQVVPEDHSPSPLEQSHFSTKQHYRVLLKPVVNEHQVPEIKKEHEAQGIVSRTAFESIIYLARNAILQAESICCICHSYTVSLLEDLPCSKPHIVVLKSNNAYFITLDTFRFCSPHFQLSPYSCTYTDSVAIMFAEYLIQHKPGFIITV